MTNIICGCDLARAYGRVVGVGGGKCTEAPEGGIEGGGSPISRGERVGCSRHKCKQVKAMISSIALRASADCVDDKTCKQFVDFGLISGPPSYEGCAGNFLTQCPETCDRYE